MKCYQSGFIAAFGRCEGKMKEIRKKLAKQAVICLVAFFLGFPMNLMAQTAEEGSAPEQSKYTQEELDRLLAPIALYPDSLLAPILMASTYPIEVVEANLMMPSRISRGMPA